MLASVDGAGPVWWSLCELLDLPRACADEKVKVGDDDVYVVKTAEKVEKGK